MGMFDRVAQRLLDNTVKRNLPIRTEGIFFTGDLNLNSRFLRELSQRDEQPQVFQVG